MGIIAGLSNMLDVQIKQEVDSDEGNENGAKNVIDGGGTSSKSHNADYDGDADDDVDDNATANGNAKRNGNDQLLENGKAERGEEGVEPKRLRIVNHVSESGRVYPVGIQTAGRSNVVERLKITCKQPEKLLRPQRLVAMRQGPIQQIQQRGQVRISRISATPPQSPVATRQQAPHQQQQQQSSKVQSGPTAPQMRPAPVRMMSQGGQTTQANCKNCNYSPL